MISGAEEPRTQSARAVVGTKTARARLSRLLGRWIEILVLTLVVVSPWLFGGVEPTHEWWLFGGVAFGLLLWAARVLVEGRVSWRPCSVTLCTLAIIYLGFAQLVPLPDSVMSWISPATKQTQDFLRPETPEKLTLQNGDFSAAPAQPHPLSFYFTATAQTIFRLLAAVALFALVRNNIPSQTGLLHLAIAASINGAALSLLAIFQLFSSPPTQIYWNFNAPVVVFGPFICRNHFPFYINCCIGLALGLLVYSQGPKIAGGAERNGSSHSHRRRHSSRNGSAARSDSSSPGFLSAATLWIGVGLALMLVAVVLSLSRGGVVVLFATAVIAFLVWGRKLLHLSTMASGLVVAAAGVFALLSWFGFNLVKDRLETLMETGGLEARTPLWSSCLPLFGKYPFFGTGYGTFQLVEPLHRAYVSQDFNRLIFAHAHNEFIEAMVEGGVIRLLLSLAAIGFVFAAGYRVLRNQAGASAGLVAGALFAFTTVVLHSLGDFGMHVPAITILIAVLAAFIMSSADDIVVKVSRTETIIASPPRLLRWGGLAPTLAASTLLGLGVFLFAQSYHWQRVHRFLNAMGRPDGSDVALLEKRIEYLRYAEQLAPTYATTELELAQAYYDAYSGQQNVMAVKEDAAELFSPFLSFVGYDGSFASILNLATHTLPVTVRWQGTIAAREKELESSYLKPALRYFLAARDICPLLGKPHARLAAHIDQLAKGDSGRQYMERVRYLRKYDPEVWYISGILAMTAGKEKEAWESWKRSLEYSDEFLLDIARRSLTILSVDELLDEVIPENPRQLVRLATGLFPKPADKLQREPFLTEALELLEQPKQTMTWEDWRLKAQVLQGLGRSGDARIAFQTAIQLDPSQIELRLEYATFLHKGGFPREAQAELLAILAKDPANAKAKALFAVFDKPEPRK